MWSRFPCSFLVAPILMYEWKSSPWCIWRSVLFSYAERGIRRQCKHHLSGIWQGIQIMHEPTAPVKVPSYLIGLRPVLSSWRFWRWLISLLTSVCWIEMSCKCCSIDGASWKKMQYCVYDASSSTTTTTTTAVVRDSNSFAAVLYVLVWWNFNWSSY